MPGNYLKGGVLPDISFGEIVWALADDEDRGFIGLQGSSGTIACMNTTVNIIGAGLAGSEAALRLSSLGFQVRLFEMRPFIPTPVHHTDDCAELVCSNSLKSMKPESAAGMLKEELRRMKSPVFACAEDSQVPAGGALAVNRNQFSQSVTAAIEADERISLIRAEVRSVLPDGDLLVSDCECADPHPAGLPADAVIVASGPLTSDSLAQTICSWTGMDNLAFYDAAAPIVMADSLDYDKLFRQSRYEEEGSGDYLNAAMNKEEYLSFIDELLKADRVIAKDFETKDLFQACQPIEEIARKSVDAPRFGTLKPVGLTDPATGRRPWAALQLRTEDAHGQSYNLVGFQTNLTFGEQKRVFSMIPGLENAEFARYGVMHRNTFVDAPKVLDQNLRFSVKGADSDEPFDVPVYFAGQVSGTEGYCEAIRSGAHAAICVAAFLRGIESPRLPPHTVFGALIEYATSPETEGYQPMHVNFGIIEPLEKKVKNKGERYAQYAARAREALDGYVSALQDLELLPRTDA